MEYIISRTVDNGLRRGLLGGNKVWLILGAAAVGTRIIIWSARRTDKTQVSRFHMEPGTTLAIIAHSNDQ